MEFPLALSGGTAHQQETSIISPEIQQLKVYQISSQFNIHRKLDFATFDKV
jgi:hypothetical protein